MKYSSCISVMRMDGLVFLEVARISIRKLLMCVNLTKAVNTMLKNDEVDYYTKCTDKPNVKEHMCEECYTEHCQWLRELSAPKQDDDQWYTLYESGVWE